MSGERTLRVAIIGAGMSGICMAVKLQDAGIDDFVVYESADESVVPGATTPILA